MLLPTLLGIALLDSLNPSIILMTLFLLSTANPLKRTISYISGVFLTSWALGLLAYFGLGAAFSLIISKIFNTTAWWAYGIELIAALLLLYFAITMKTNGDAKIKKRPTRLSPLATFMLGVGATFIEFSTAAPYLGAIALLVKDNPGASYSVFALATYNVVYVIIPLVFIAIYVTNRQKAEPVLASVNQNISHWMKQAAKIFFAVLGIVLLIDFITYLMGNPLLG